MNNLNQHTCVDILQMSMQIIINNQTYSMYKNTKIIHVRE